MKAYLEYWYIDLMEQDAGKIAGEERHQWYYRLWPNRPY